MRKILLHIIILSITVVCHAYEPLPPVYDGSMMPYPLGMDQKLDMVAPDSLRPVMINYVGRHGARYLSSARKVESLREALHKASAENCLTADGMVFLALLDRVDSVTGGDWGALDPLGCAEQRALAMQMHALCPDLLSTGRVEAMATYVPRVVMSMYEFCHSLCRVAPGLEIHTSEGKQFNALLRYFTTDSAYVSYLSGGKWRGIYDSYVAREVPAAPARRLVGDFCGDDAARYRRLTMDMYGVLQSLRATGLGAPTTRWMTAGEYEMCWRASNLQHCLERTATPLSDVAALSARPLLQSLISSMDSAGMASAPVAVLRFGHAETLMPLLSLMRLPGCDASHLDDYSEVYLTWRDYDVVPLAANLLIVTLRAPSGRLYACLRLNGRWVAPVPDGRMLVPSAELTAYWRTLMES